MNRDLITRYVWIVDTISRYGKITRQELNALWVRSSLSDGQPIPPRTFFHHRRAIEEHFHVDIKCNSAGEYYIEAPASKQDEAFRNWLMDSYAVRGVMSDSGDVSGRILVEEVPSARLHLPTVMDALKRSYKIMFTYHSFSRSKPETGIVFHPYFVRLYKQRWYMVGYKEKSKALRTYALDRVSEMRPLTDEFVMPDDVSPDAFFEDYVGVTTSLSAVREVRIQVDSTQAKYFRALPLHHSQQEVAHETFSIFTYHLKLNYELVHELLSYGSSVKVLEPPQLKAMVISELTRTLDQY